MDKQREHNQLPPDNLTERELDMIILKIGSFLSILSNRKCNQAKLLITVVQNKYFSKMCMKLTEIDNLQTLVENILIRYPTISKSKLVTNTLSK